MVHLHVLAVCLLLSKEQLIVPTVTNHHNIALLAYILIGNCQPGKLSWDGITMYIDTRVGELYGIT